MPKPYSKEQQTHGYVPGPKKKQPISKVSAKKKFRCSDGLHVSQSYILNKLTKAYRSARPLTVCECCGLQPASDHDHTLSKEKCKQIGRTELIWFDGNWSNSCRACHNEWGYLSAAMEDHKNFVERMLFLKQHDKEEYMKRRNKVSNYQILKQLPEQLEKSQSLVSPDRHKWKNNVCERCGCERTPSYGVYIYERSSIFFDSSPACIDWNIENSKTID